ncbi:hypothetical protein [Streptomonospora wellingtoniae]|uniref:Uncharacterized protein n=1 Tax=Streptomonospora wellingtoniae TaxID=3075544 RepID=A0ABU2KT97_9ACTN|nr:hypothetical protein [Streptomonospora sp. DSM 45055]MDT0302487.1 hypothetical protein [Streptomonospora sp. DSM 45055]
MGQIITSERLLWGALVVALAAGAVTVYREGFAVDSSAIGAVVVILSACLAVRHGEKTGGRDGA